MQSKAEAKADAAGGAKDPGKTVGQALSPANPQLCPETNAACAENPPCILPGNTGRTYCVRWKVGIQTAEIERRANGKDR